MVSGAQGGNRRLSATVSTVLELPTLVLQPDPQDMCVLDVPEWGLEYFLPSWSVGSILGNRLEIQQPR
ncbi:hypothetical protein OH492_18040 [Vibrio chagasii]|nr:hypothetical protein [Vibrio chagasii]